MAAPTRRPTGGGAGAGVVAHPRAPQLRQSTAPSSSGGILSHPAVLLAIGAGLALALANTAIGGPLVGLVLVAAILFQLNHAVGG